MHESDGAQSLERGLRILRVIAASGVFGRRLIDIETETGLARSTAHRIAQTLARNDFVRYDRASRRYFVGSEISILSVSAPAGMAELRHLAQDALRALALATGDTAYLMVRSGNDIVCIAREMGPYPIKALTGEIGTRRPLGVGAAGIALLAHMNPADDEAVRRANRSRLRRFPGATERAVTNAVQEARATGVAFSEGLVIAPVRGVGRVIQDPSGKAVAAISVGATQERMTEEHRAKVTAVLVKACQMLERRLAREPGLIGRG
ncbi:MAG: IclR family transcriptional regulator [Phreatobacter sp.]|jgi:DNA-binding IclR family transcriptional regulator|uniref:IclR family transcriptional regulator n=1 Tax=Phreatobacter sp. TaxID=1966341 RepID=UPI004036379F